jgi:hypothetical protein
MGYRHYFYSVDKKLYNSIKGLTYEGLGKKLKNLKDRHGHKVVEHYEGERTYIGLYNIGKTVYEFGKYFEPASDIMKSGTEFFTRKETQEEFDDYLPFVVGEEAFKIAIEHYRDKVVANKKDMLNQLMGEKPEEYCEPRNIKREIISDLLEWGCKAGFESDDKTGDVIKINGYGEYKGFSDKPWRPYEMDLEIDTIVRSWRYEYAVFELVRAYKTFDFKKNVILFMGW